MANICDNTFFAYSEDKKNISTINDFLTKELEANIEKSEETIDASFDSKWTFPEELMVQLYEKLPNKKDIFMRVLSVEYGCDYIAYWKCDEHGWYQEV